MIAAVVPAAGRSTRMGQPKLILPIAGVPVIGRVVDALREGGIEHIVVVTAPLTEPAAPEIARIAIDAGASVVHLENPTAHMRDTIQEGLSHLKERFTDKPPSGVAIVPADCVGITPALVAELAARFRESPTRILVPMRDGKRGHPLFIPWLEAMTIEALPADVGVNAMLAERAAIVDEFEVTSEGDDRDLDTPEDYAAWSQE